MNLKISWDISGAHCSKYQGRQSTSTNLKSKHGATAQVGTICSRSRASGASWSDHQAYGSPSAWQRWQGPWQGRWQRSWKRKRERFQKEGDQEESKEQPKKKLKAPRNGTERPDFFEGKVETDGRSVVVPPQPDMPSPQQRDILLGSDLHGAGVKDDDDTPTPPVGQPSVAARVLGCPRCYYSKNGCSICRRPGYTPRGPNVRTTGPKAKADPKQKVKKPQAKTKAAAKSKFPKTPGRGKARGRARAQWAKVLLYDLF